MIRHLLKRILHQSPSSIFSSPSSPGSDSDSRSEGTHMSSSASSDSRFLSFITDTRGSINLIWISDENHQRYKSIRKPYVFPTHVWSVFQWRVFEYDVEHCLCISWSTGNVTDYCKIFKVKKHTIKQPYTIYGFGKISTIIYHILTSTQNASPSGRRLLDMNS